MYGPDGWGGHQSASQETSVGAQVALGERTNIHSSPCCSRRGRGGAFSVLHCVLRAWVVRGTALRASCIMMGQAGALRLPPLADAVGLVDAAPQRLHHPLGICSAAAADGGGGAGSALKWWATAAAGGRLRGVLALLDRQSSAGWPGTQIRRAAACMKNHSPPSSMLVLGCSVGDGGRGRGRGQAPPTRGRRRVWSCQRSRKGRQTASQRTL